MGKKNKKNKDDIFDMSPEEQKANANAFYEMEQGSLTLFDVLNIKPEKMAVSQSSFKKQIEEAYLQKNGGQMSDDDDDEFMNAVGAALKENRVSISDKTEVDTPYSYNVNYGQVEALQDDDDDTETEIYVSETETTESVDGRKYESDPFDDDTENDIVKTVSDEVVKNHKIIPEQSNGLHKIMFNYDNITGRMKISDGLITTPVNVCATSSIELNEENFPIDSDSLSYTLSRLFFYIITCKHPTVIMSKDTFDIEMTIFSSINHNKFVFFERDGLIFAYVIDDDAVNNYYSVIDIFKLDDESVLRYAIGAADAASSVHNIFMYNDEDEIEAISSERHEIKKLISLIESDPDTKYAGHIISQDIMKDMHVLDHEAVIADAMILIDSLTNINDDDVEDEIEYDDESVATEIDDEDDNDTDEIDINDFPDIDSAIDQLEDLDAEREHDKLQEYNASNNNPDGEMVLPIIRRH